MKCPKCKRKWRPGPGVVSKRKPCQPKKDKSGQVVAPAKCKAGFMCGVWTRKGQGFCTLPIHNRKTKHKTASGHRWKEK